MNGDLLGSVREKFSRSERKRERQFLLLILDIVFFRCAPSPHPGTDAGILPENKTNKWQRKEPREERNRRKSSMLKNY